jgi:hypothetical protein
MGTSVTLGAFERASANEVDNDVNWSILCSPVKICAHRVKPNCRALFAPLFGSPCCDACSLSYVNDKSRPKQDWPRRENSAGFGDRCDTVCEDVERRSPERRPFDIHPVHTPLYRACLRRLGVIHAHTLRRGNAAKNAAGANCLRIQDKDSSQSSLAWRAILRLAKYSFWRESLKCRTR